MYIKVIKKGEKTYYVFNLYTSGKVWTTSFITKELYEKMKSIGIKVYETIEV